MIPQFDFVFLPLYQAFVLIYPLFLPTGRVTYWLKKYIPIKCMLQKRFSICLEPQWVPFKHTLECWVFGIETKKIN